MIRLVATLLAEFVEIFTYQVLALRGVYDKKCFMYRRALGCMVLYPADDSLVKYVRSFTEFVRFPANFEVLHKVSLQVLTVDEESHVVEFPPVAKLRAIEPNGSRESKSSIVQAITEALQESLSSIVRKLSELPMKTQMGPPNKAALRRDWKLLFHVRPVGRTSEYFPESIFSRDSKPELSSNRTSRKVRYPLKSVVAACRASDSRAHYTVSLYTDIICLSEHDIS